MSATPKRSATAPATFERGKARHLHSVDEGPIPKTARRSRWIPVYEDVLAFGLPAGPALLYHLLIRDQGDEEDGRLPSAAQKEALKNGQPLPVKLRTQAELARLLGHGTTRDNVQAWTKVLEEKAWPCPWCGWGHKLIRTSRRYTGGPIAYEIVKCRDLLPSELVSADELAANEAAAELGSSRYDERGKDQKFTPKGAVPQTGGPELDGSEACGKTPHGQPGERAGKPRTLGAPAAPVPVEGRRALLAQLIAEELLAAEGLPVDVLEMVAGLGESAAEIEHALVPVVAQWRLQGGSITLGEAERAVARERAGYDRAVDALLELAHRREPGLTRKYMTDLVNGEIKASALRAAGGDVVAAQRMILAAADDPRIRRHPNPIGTLRQGAREGWIWSDPTAEDDYAQYARAFEKLSQRDREAAIAIATSHVVDGMKLDEAALRRCGVTTAKMRAFLVARVQRADSTQPSTE